MLAKKFFPETIDKISNALTPMVATARVIKKEHPDASVVFIGPCVAKKLEASRRSVRSDVDFVITFEELTGMFEAKGIDITKVEEETPIMVAISAVVGMLRQVVWQVLSRSVYRSIIRIQPFILSMSKVSQTVKRSIDACKAG